MSIRWCFLLGYRLMFYLLLFLDPLVLCRSVDTGKTHVLHSPERRILLSILESSHVLFVDIRSIAPMKASGSGSSWLPPVYNSSNHPFEGSSSVSISLSEIHPILYPIFKLFLSRIFRYSSGSFDSVYHCWNMILLSLAIISGYHPNYTRHTRHLLCRKHYSEFTRYDF